jgi:hypothetical protein
MPFIEEDFQAIWHGTHGDRQVGHAHFWERALSRRRFLVAGALATGAVLAPEMWLRAFAGDGFSPPNPILGGTVLPFEGLTGFYFPSPNPFSNITIENKTGDPSTIRDFNGFVGMGEWAGGPVAGGTLTWNADMRFMKGEFVGKDGQEHRAAFAFI